MFILKNVHKNFILTHFSPIKPQLLMHTHKFLAFVYKNFSPTVVQVEGMTRQEPVEINWKNTSNATRHIAPLCRNRIFGMSNFSLPLEDRKIVNTVLVVVSVWVDVVGISYAVRLEMDPGRFRAEMLCRAKRNRWPAWRLIGRRSMSSPSSR